MKKIGILLIGAVLSLFLLGCGNRVELLRDIAEVEGNEAVSALHSAGIESSKISGKDGLVNISVDQSQVAEAIAILNSEGLPREQFAKMGDVFKKEGLISSPLEERARYVWALSQELSATLAQIDGVIKARVHVVLPEKIGGGDPSLPSSAAVFIKHKPGIILDDSITQIKRLVSNSIPGLSADKVTVVMLTSMVRQSKDFGEKKNEDLPPTHQSNTNALKEIALKIKSENTTKLVDTNMRTMIVGVIGTIILLACMTAAIIFWRRAKRSNSDTNSAVQKSIPSAPQT